MMKYQNLVRVGLVLLAVTSLVQGAHVITHIGTLPTLQHRVSGEFHIIDSKTLFFDDFNYDGGGPGAFLYYYPPGARVDRNGGGVVIPLPPSVGQTGGSYPGSFQRRPFNNEDFTVTLPDGIDACDIGTITVWCQPFRAIFTQLVVPRTRFVDNGADPCTVIGEATEPPIVPEFDNCEVLHDTLQLSWKVDNSSSNVRFRLCGCTATDASTIQYLGFGFSGSTAVTSMFRADATIAWVDSNGMAQAQDYYLSNYVQCRGGSGACPDTVDTSTGSTCTNDVTDVSGFVQEGQQCISFTRPFNPTDSGTCDRPIDPTNQNQYIVWGIGSLGATAFQHHTRATTTTSPLHLGRAPKDSCTDVELMCQQCDPFPSEKFVAKEDATFVAVIGPAANPRGYTAITGQPGWGIAWYLNDTLVPELTVERGRTYTFLVYGGNNPNDASNYHPFYITNSSNGGRLLNTDAERMSELVYAGFDGETPTGVGPLCEFTETSVSETLRQSCGSYTMYKDSLNSVCQSGDPATVVWTPDNNTPDVVYYQCASHLNLGWRINVEGSFAPPTTTESAPTTTSETTTTPVSTQAPTTAPPALPPAPTDVEGICSHVVWRVPAEVSCADITGYEVVFSNPTTNDEETREATADGSFYKLSEEYDSSLQHGDTKIQVRIVTSSGSGVLSEEISLGCPPTEPEGPSVYFELNGQKYPNNSVVTISAIGENDNALVCKTDKTECCSTLPNRFGQFYYPNTAQVPINRVGDGFYRNRGPQLIRLNRRAGTVGPTGLYSCEIPDSSGTNRKIFVNLTASQA